MYKHEGEVSFKMKVSSGLTPLSSFKYITCLNIFGKQILSNQNRQTVYKINN